MSAIKHTPGPWNIGAPPPNGEQTIGTQQGLMVAVATTGAGVPAEANARLIAAAPELLSSLQFAVKLLSALPHVNGTAQLDYMRAAIAKATGGAA